MAEQIQHPTLTVPLAPVDHVIGPASAPAVVIEYADFECPYCIQAHPATKILLRQYAGKIRFAFRHFPDTEQHPHAELAAEASEAAAAQGRFWPMHDRIFEHPQHLTAHALREHAEALELDMRRYDSEMAERIYLQRVKEQQAGGRASRIRGTPTFFLNGSIVDASYGMQHVMEAIAAAAR
jgi:protein-disulfide isomerase